MLRDIFGSCKGRLSKIYYMLLTVMTVTDQATLKNWKQDLQDVSIKTWEQNNWLGHTFSRNVMLQEAVYKICHQWLNLHPSHVAKWFPPLF